MTAHGNGASASDDVVARAIKELIDSVPGEEEAPAPDAETTTAQPWAETASPSASNKRPLEALLAEYAARVEAAPGATARLPGDPHPATDLLRPIRPPRGAGRRRPEKEAEGVGAQASGRPGPRTPARLMGPAGARLGGRPIDALLLDYGLTLVSFTRPTEALLRAHEEIAVRLRAAGVGPVPSAATLLAEIHDRVEESVARHEASGALTEIDAVAEERRAYAALGLQLSDELLDEVAALAQRAWWEGVALPPATADTLSELRRRGLRLGLCSNAPYRPRSLRGQLAHLGLTGLLDSVTLSSEVGRRKPAPEIFAAALRALGVEAEPERDGGGPPPRGRGRRPRGGSGDHPRPRASGRPGAG